MPFNPFSALTSKLFASLSGVLLIALGVCAFGWSHAANQRDDQIRANGALETKLAVSNASIADLQLTLSRYVGAGKASRVAQLAAVEAQAKDNAALKAQADAIRAEVAKLPEGGCDSPKSVISAKGL